MAPSWTRFIVSRRGRAIAPAEARDDGEVLLLGLLARPEDGADARGVGGDRLLDEGVDPLLHRVGQVQRAEVGRGGQQDHVDLVDDVLVGVEPDVLAVRRHVHPRRHRRGLAGSGRLESSWSWKASAMATSRTPGSAVSACSAAPVPRPPQPTRPTRSVSLPPAKAFAAISSCVVAAAAASVAADCRTNPRRLGWVSCIGIISAEKGCGPTPQGMGPSSGSNRPAPQQHTSRIPGSSRAFRSGGRQEGKEGTVAGKERVISHEGDPPGIAPSPWMPPPRGPVLGPAYSLS